MVILSDENCHGHALMLEKAIYNSGLDEIITFEVKSFDEVGLARGSNDRTVWEFCQAKGYLLLTNNRTANDGDESLEIVMRRLADETSLPVLTIGSLDRVFADQDYCLRCANRIADIVWGIEQNGQYLGTPRIYIPF